MTRCEWGDTNDTLMRDYHDKEWGRLDLSPSYLYEMMVLESFQSGLSWQIILRKRENFRKAFANFDHHKVAGFTENEYERLLVDEGIVRNKLKIKAALNNAKVLAEMEKNGEDLGKWLLSFIPEPIINYPNSTAEILSSDELSTKISKELKKKGFKFMGPVTTYSFLQAIGLVNDHIAKCEYKF